MSRATSQNSKFVWGAGVAPQEWRERLDTLPVPQRYAAARIVWWEFFAERKVSRRWPHLDDLLAQRDEVEDPVLFQALLDIGAPPGWAARRIKGGA